MGVSKKSSKKNFIYCSYDSQCIISLIINISHIINIILAHRFRSTIHIILSFILFLFIYICIFLHHNAFLCYYFLLINRIFFLLKSFNKKYYYEQFVYMRSFILNSYMTVQFEIILSKLLTLA